MLTNEPNEIKIFGPREVFRVIHLSKKFEENLLSPYKDCVRFSYDKFEMSYSQGNIMGELCNNALTLIVNPHSIIPTPAKEKDNVSPPPPRIRLITKPATEKPVKHTLLYA